LRGVQDLPCLIFSSCARISANPTCPCICAWHTFDICAWHTFDICAWCAHASEAVEETNTEMPRAAKAVITILRAMGVQEYDPRVIQQLLDFVHSRSTMSLRPATALQNLLHVPTAIIFFCPCHTPFPVSHPCLHIVSSSSVTRICARCVGRCVPLRRAP